MSTKGKVIIQNLESTELINLSGKFSEIKFDFSLKNMDDLKGLRKFLKSLINNGAEFEEDIVKGLDKSESEFNDVVDAIINDATANYMIGSDMISESQLSMKDYLSIYKMIMSFLDNIVTVVTALRSKKIIINLNIHKVYVCDEYLALLHGHFKNMNEYTEIAKNKF